MFGKIKITYQLFLIFLFLGCVSVSFAQSNMPMGSASTILKMPGASSVSLKSMSLLDPKRFSMRNQYSMEFSSMNGAGGLVGTYINSMEYRFNCPLVMRLKVAYQSQTGHLFGSSNAYSGIPNNEQGNLFIPSFDLIYKPFKNTTISFGYRDYRNNSYYGNGYGSYGYSPYGYSPYMRY